MLKVLLSFRFLKGINGEETEKENIPVHSPMFSNYKDCGLKSHKMEWSPRKGRGTKRLIPDEFWNRGRGTKRWQRLLETVSTCGSDTRLASAAAQRLGSPGLSGAHDLLLSDT